MPSYKSNLLHLILLTSIGAIHPLNAQGLVKNITKTNLTSDPIVINDTVTLDSVKLLKAKKLVFGPNGGIVTNAFFLSIDVDEIEVAGQPKIVSFDGPGAGLDGRNAGSILIKTKTFSGDGSIVVNNLGGNGRTGNKGNTGGQGSQGAQGREYDWELNRGCVNGTDGRPGNPGLQGETGQRAGNAGQGGDLILVVSSGLIRKDGTTRIIASVAAGSVGTPGAGGSGGPGGPGGPGAPAKGICSGTNGGPQGPIGPSGLPGANGSPAVDGKIYVQSDSETVAKFFSVHKGRI